MALTPHYWTAVMHLMASLSLRFAGVPMLAQGQDFCVQSVVLKTLISVATLMHSIIIAVMFIQGRMAIFATG